MAGPSSAARDFAGVPEASAARLLILADRLARTLAVARGLMLAGRMVDLTGVQDGIGLLCAQTLDLPNPEGRRVLPALHELTAQIDALSAVLREAAAP